MILTIFPKSRYQPKHNTVDSLMLYKVNGNTELVIKEPLFIEEIKG